MATPRRALGDVKNSLLGSSVKQLGKDTNLKLGQGSPRRALGDVKNNLLGSEKKQLNNEKNFKAKIIDFNENDNELIQESPKKSVQMPDEDFPPVETCSCSHDHRTKEQYTLIPDDTDFEPIVMDTYDKMDDWMAYCATKEKQIKSWSKFLADNGLI